MARIVGKILIDNAAGVVRMEVADRGLPGLMRDGRFKYAGDLATAAKDGYIGEFSGIPVYLKAGKGA